MTVHMTEIKVTKPVRAIVRFGPETDQGGFRGGEYFECVLDPNMASPGGEYIRFDQRIEGQGNEIHGWQRVEAMTVCEILGDYVWPDTIPKPEGYTVDPNAVLIIRCVKAYENDALATDALATVSATLKG